MRTLRRVLMLFLLASTQAALAQAPGRSPLQVAEAPGLYQRVLTLPGARLSAEQGAPPGAVVLPTFSILYVFSRAKAGDADWLEVGAKVRGRPDGWLPASVTQEWHSMLVMQYAPHGQRDRVAFFRDEAALGELLAADDSTQRGREIAAGLARNKPDPAIIAAEPTHAINLKAQFYVMPVIAAKVKALADGTPVRMVEVASAVAQPPPKRPVTPNIPPPPPLPPPDNYRTGLVFLLDTTMSMQPYLDVVKQTVRDINEKLVRAGVADRVSIGYVGYRSNMSREPRLEYVTRIFANLDPKAPPQRTLPALDQMNEARYSTPAWDEDAFAGLHTAINDINWDPFAARLLVLVTDSGALTGKNPLVQYPNFDVENVVDLARARRVAVFPVHLLTPEGDKHGNRSRAVAQWKRVGETGDGGVPKYMPIPAGSPEVFRQTVAALGDQLVAGVRQIAADHPLVRPDIPTKIVPVKRDEPPPAAAASLVNELFRAQAEYLGEREKTGAPPFFNAWASDHDLARPRLRSLDVQVFLTRTQLSDLAQSLKLIVDQAKQAALSPQDFFDNLQVLSAHTASDPNRPASTGSVGSIRESNLLPSFVKLLPYHSKVLDMTRDGWLSGGVTGQQEFIDELDFKVQEYADIETNTSRWTPLAANSAGVKAKDAGDDVCAVSLDVLP